MYRQILWLIALAVAGCSPKSVESITIKGSDTEVNLVLQLAEAYMETDPQVSVGITGGGSGVGIAALLNHKTDIANSSREMSSKEILMARERGVDAVPFIFAWDALAVVVHPQTGLDSIHWDDLGALYSGKITNWAQLGGNNLPVSLYGRQSNSGTYIYFREKVLGCDFSNTLKQMNGTAQIIEAVKNDPGAIGYVGLGYLTDHKGVPRAGFKILNVAMTRGEQSVSPLNMTQVRAGLYPLTRPLFQYTNGIPLGKIQAFLEFEKSQAAHRIIEQNGYLPPLEFDLVHQTEL